MTTLATALPEDLERWLSTAMHGLSEADREIVRAEIVAHYEDALADHQAAGLTSREAHAATMTELGDVKATAQAMREAYLSGRKYIAAAIISMVFPIAVALIVSNRFSDVLTMQIVFGLSLFLPTVYMLDAFKTLLTERCIVDLGHLPKVLAVGLAASVSAIILGWLIFNQPVPIVGSPLPLNVLERLFGYVNLGGDFALAVGLLLLSERLAYLQYGLYGLRRPLRYTLLLTAYGLFAYVLAGLAESKAGLELTTLVTMIVHVITCALWALLFFRAAYRGSVTHPTQARTG